VYDVTHMRQRQLENAVVNKLTVTWFGNFMKM